VKYQAEIAVFDGGLNTKAAPNTLSINQSPSLLNVSFDNFGAVGTRGGQLTPYAPIASATIDGLAVLRLNNSTSFLVAMCNSTLWYAAGASFVPVTGSTGIYTAGVDVCFLVNQNRLMMTNGFAQPYKWDGTYFTKFGVSAPVVVVSAVCAGTGLLNGTYQYLLTGVNSAQVESNVGPVNSGLAIVSGEVNISGIPIYPASAGVVGINIYRNTAGVVGTFLLVTQVVNGQTAVVDNNPDASLVTFSPTDNGTMPPCKFTCQYQGRVFAAGNPAAPMTVYFSNPEDGEWFPALNFLNISDGDGYPISGIALLGNSIIIHKNDGNGNGSIWLLYIPDSTGASGADNWYLIKAASAYGGQSNKAIVPYNNLQTFLNSKGLFALSGNNLAISAADAQVGSFQSDSKSFNIEPNIFAMNNPLVSGSAGCLHNNRLWFSIPSSGLSANNDQIMLYDYQRVSNPDTNTGAWSLFSGHNIQNFADYAGNLYGGSSIANGLVYQLDSGVSDSGNPIDSYFVTAGINGLPEHKDHTKVWRWLYVWYYCEGNWNVNISWLLDYGTTYSTPVTLNLTPGGSLWGLAKFNVSNWGGGQANNKAKIGLLGNESRDIQFKFEINAANQYWKINKIQVVYNLRSLR
jgi:hypothetical protein